jgi:hypothetical protein
MHASREKQNTHNNNNNNTAYVCMDYTATFFYCAFFPDGTTKMRGMLGLQNELLRPTRHTSSEIRRRCRPTDSHMSTRTRRRPA